MYWMSNRDWWELKNHIPTVKEDAPIEAKVSYKRYKEQLKSIWDDEYSAKYQVELEREIKSVKNAQEQVNNQIQMWQSAIKEMEDTVGGQQEKLQLIKEGLSVLDIKD